MSSNMVFKLHTLLKAKDFGKFENRKKIRQVMERVATLSETELTAFMEQAIFQIEKRGYLISYKYSILPDAPTTKNLLIINNRYRRFMQKRVSDLLKKVNIKAKYIIALERGYIHAQILAAKNKHYVNIMQYTGYYHSHQFEFLSSLKSANIADVELIKLINWSIDSQKNFPEGLTFTELFRERSKSWTIIVEHSSITIAYLISQRKQLSDQVIDKLIDFNRFLVTKSLIQNENISMNNNAILKLLSSSSFEIRILTTARGDFNNLSMTTLIKAYQIQSPKFHNIKEIIGDFILQKEESKKLLTDARFLTISDKYNQQAVKDRLVPYVIKRLSTNSIE